MRLVRSKLLYLLPSAEVIGMLGLSFNSSTQKTSGSLPLRCTSLSTVIWWEVSSFSSIWTSLTHIDQAKLKHYVFLKLALEWADLRTLF